MSNGQATVFETMVKDLQPDTVKKLTGWRPPRDAYVLFEARVFHVKPGGAYEPGFDLLTLNVEARPEQQDKLAYYVKDKGYRIIHYGNFPRLDDPRAGRRAQAKLYSGKNGSNPWDELALECNRYMKLVEGSRSELAGIQAKLAEAEARAKAAEAKLDTRKVAGRE